MRSEKQITPKSHRYIIFLTEGRMLFSAETGRNHCVINCLNFMKITRSRGVVRAPR